MPYFSLHSPQSMEFEFKWRLKIDYICLNAPQCLKRIELYLNINIHCGSHTWLAAANPIYNFLILAITLYIITLRRHGHFGLSARCGDAVRSLHDETISNDSNFGMDELNVFHSSAQIFDVIRLADCGDKCKHTSYIAGAG